MSPPRRTTPQTARPSTVKPRRPLRLPSRSFDRVARAYHLLELLTFGPWLRRAREHFLPQLLHARHALVLGDGDGRFLHALLRRNSSLRTLAIDASPRMLELLAARSLPDRPRLDLLQADLTQPAALAPTLALSPPFDLVITHFFLDCLSTPQLQALLTALRPHLAPNALWVVSDFRIPSSGPLRPVARALVRLLYLAFGLLTGLRNRHLPDHARAFHQAGFHRPQQQLLLGGILVAELWVRNASPYHMDRSVK